MSFNEAGALKAVGYRLQATGKRPSIDSVLNLELPMRDHTKLRAFELADVLALDMYRMTEQFPRTEQFGLTSQMRRAAVSIACNIVEGCARSTQADYVRFLDLSYGSAKELEYQISLATRLGYLPRSDATKIAKSANETSRVLAGLIRSLRRNPPGGPTP